MADPSAYLTRLTWLKKLINGNSSPEPAFNSELSERLRLLSILIAVQDTTRYFQEETVKADASILLHIDEDINYLEWTSAEWMVGYNWMCSDETIIKEQLSNAWTANIDPQVTDKQADNLADYLPESVISSFNATGGKKTLSQFFQVIAGPYYNTSNLQMAVYQAVLTLTETLKNLKNTLTKDRSPEEFEAMVIAQWTAYNMVSNGEAVRIKMEYEEDRNSLSDPLSFEWLVNRRSRVIAKFSESDFMKQKMEECGLDAPKSLARLCSNKNGYLVFDKNASLGRFICKRRITQQQMEQFFAFRKRIELIQADMPAFEPAKPKKKVKLTENDTITFQLGNITDGHLQLLRLKLMEVGWIAKDTQPDDFAKLFSGTTNHTKIVWTGCVGKGMLVFLFKEMEKHHYLIVPENNSINTILECHFVDEIGRKLTGLHSSKPTEKFMPIIKQCLDQLQIEINLD